MYPFFAPVARGLEALLREEIEKFGGSEVKETVAGVSWKASWQGALQVLMGSRLASRVLMPLAEFPAADGDQLYEGISKIAWSEHLDPRMTFVVDATLRQSSWDHSQFAAQRSKDAIVDQFRRETGRRPQIEREEPDLRLNLLIKKDIGTLSLDLGGMALHRRGYRQGGGEAPLKESLAAGILIRAGWPEIAKRGGPLIDPMCGSGTLLFEAALMALEIAPGLLRPPPAVLRWKGAEVTEEGPLLDLWKEIVDQAEDARSLAADRKCWIVGADPNPKVVAAARRAAKHLDLIETCRIESRALSGWQEALPSLSSLPPGLVVVNPPYGERLGELPELVALYTALGQWLRDHCGGWKASVFTGNPDLCKQLRMRPDKRYKLFNGAIPCELLNFTILSEAERASLSTGKRFPTEARSQDEGGSWVQKSEAEGSDKESSRREAEGSDERGGEEDEGGSYHEAGGRSRRKVGGRDKDSSRREAEGSDKESRREAEGSDEGGGEEGGGRSRREVEGSSRQEAGGGSRREVEGSSHQEAGGGNRREVEGSDERGGEEAGGREESEEEEEFGEREEAKASVPGTGGKGGKREEMILSVGGRVELSEGAAMFKNRLQKMKKHFSKWLKREGISCYRVYDADMPEYNVAIDVYEDYALIQEYEAPATVDPERAKRRLFDILLVAPEVLEIPRSNVILKVRRRQRGESQYERFDQQKDWLEVSEGGYRFWANLTDYLDTGLFLDHRMTRKLLQEKARGARFLNLFAYTGTASVYAAGGGASSTLTVDMSHTYLSWARENMELNGFEGPQHRFLQADCMAWLEEAEGSFDLIFLDPPTFSNSKRMQTHLDIQRDHVLLIREASRLLEEDGLLIFSSNHRSFKLSEEEITDLGLVWEDLSRRTLPKDFERNPRIHRCFAIRHRSIS